MRLIDSTWRVLQTAAASIACWTALYGTALAKGPEPVKTGGGGFGAWVMPYALVLLAVALGILVVCHPSRRHDRAKPEQYEAAPATKDAAKS